MNNKLKTGLVVLNYNDYKTTIKLIKMIKDYKSIDLIVIVVIVQQINLIKK